VLHGRRGHGGRYVDAGVVRLGEQQRNDHDLLHAVGCQPGEGGGVTGLGQLEERRLDAQVGTQRAD
jgi:hypothetical protein